jgi:hypothetical protein
VFRGLSGGWEAVVEPQRGGGNASAAVVPNGPLLGDGNASGPVVPNDPPLQKPQGWGTQVWVWLNKSES